MLAGGDLSTTRMSALTTGFNQVDDEDERADEDDEGGGRRGWLEVISRRRGCDGDDDECSDKGDDDERSGEGDDERTARRASAWSQGQSWR